MLIKILWEDIRKNKSITIALFVFIMLAALLVSSGSNMMTELSNSLNALFTKARAPHFVQMHTGDVNQAEMDAFSSNNNLVDQQQTAEMVLIDGGHIKLGAGETERNSVMDHYFVKQNKAFDFLLNLESQVIHVGKGEIAVPVFYKQQKGLKRGDKIHISNNSRHLELTIVDFVRDVQMNPSIVHSKRFVVNDRGFNALKQDFGDIEYLLEFRLTDDGKLEDFRRAYENANLPNKGPAVDYALFKLLNAVTDGMIAIIIMVMSMVLIGIAILCMRFTIMTAMEEDYQAIGVMKAIGIAQDQIKRIYLVKYVVLAACACLLGYVLSLFFHPFFTANMMDDIGTATMPVFLRFIPLLAVILLFFMVILFCRFTLRKLHQISATEALRSGGRASTAKHKRYPALSKRRWIPVPVFLGLQDVVKRFSTYRLLCFVFLVCTFLITVPVNFLHTIQSPDFIRYMGIGRSDIRIDLQQTGESARDFHNMKSSIAQDPDVERFSPHVTNQYKVINQGGVPENITVETGDFSQFPLAYLKGKAPMHDDEIALSYLNGKELQKQVGDPISLVINGQKQEMAVSGIYQDLTNGGRTAKAVLPADADAALRYEIMLDLKPGVDIREKVAAYASRFPQAKVTDVEGYLGQTFASTIEQVRIFTFLTIGVSFLVAMLITALFIKMLIAKDDTQIAIMKRIGFSSGAIRLQHVCRSLFVLVIGMSLWNYPGKHIGTAFGEQYYVHGRSTENKLCG